MTDNKVTYEEITKRCEMLSAFEGKELLDQNGQSMFEQVRITDREHALVKTYIEKAAEVIDTTCCLGSGIGLDYNGTYVELSLSEARKKRMAHIVASRLMETISAYVMYLWMENKAPTRSTSYMQVFNDMAASFKSAIHKKQEPDN